MTADVRERAFRFAQRAVKLCQFSAEQAEMTSSFSLRPSHCSEASLVDPVIPSIQYVAELLTESTEQEAYSLSIEVSILTMRAQGHNASFHLPFFRCAPTHR